MVLTVWKNIDLQSLDPSPARKISKCIHAKIQAIFVSENFQQASNLALKADLNLDLNLDLNIDTASLILGF